MGRGPSRRRERASVAHHGGDGIASQIAALTTALLAALLLVAGWNIALGGRIAQHREVSRTLRWLSGFVALLFLPGAAAGWFALSPTAGAALHDVAWLWPLVALLATLQAFVALWTGAAPRVVTFPFALWNTLVCWVLTARWLSWLGLALPEWMLVPGGATVALTTLVLGPGSAALPSLPILPLLAPAYPPRARWSAPVRSLLAIGVSIAVVLVITEGATSPRLRATSAANAPRITERDPTRFSVGLTLLPPLSGPPPTAAIRRDVALADSLGVLLVHIRLLPGLRGSAMDSIARVLEPWRRDSASRIIVTLDEAQPLFFDRRARGWSVTEIEAVTRRIRPHILVSDVAPVTDGVPQARRTALLAHALRPRTVVLARLTTTEALWRPDVAALLSGEGAVEGFWLDLRPTPSGGRGLDQRLAPVDRWLAESPRGELWVHAVPGLPLVEGEAIQAAGVHLLVAWGSARPRVRAVVLDGAGDHREVVGLRSSNGRLRPATFTLARDLRTLVESPSR